MSCSTPFVSLVARRITRRATALFGVVLLAFGAVAVTAGPAGAAPEKRSVLSRAQVQAMQWWTATLGLQDVWRVNPGRGVTVAVVDSGVDPSFGDLRGAVVPGFAVGSSGDGRRDVDPAMHGTRIADFIAGRGTGFGLRGVAPAAKIMPVAKSSYSADDLAQVLQKLAAMSNPPDVVNMSIGSEGACQPELQDAVTAAVAKGLILVASAGNSGNTGNASEYPSNCTGVIAVGGYDKLVRVWAGSQRQDYVSLSGPAVSMIDYDGQAASGYGFATGTSNSAAVVSGTFAVVRAQFPKLSARQVVARVLYTARQFGGRQGTRNDSWGYGAARPHHALTDKVPASAPNPIYDAVDKLRASSGNPSGGSSGGPSATGSPVRPSSEPSGPSAASSGPTDLGAESGDGSSSTGVIIGVVVAVVVVLGIVLAFVLSRRRRAGPPQPPGWGP